jgi:hypothetical protein
LPMSYEFTCGFDIWKQHKEPKCKTLPCIIKTRVVKIKR